MKIYCLSCRKNTYNKNLRVANTTTRRKTLLSKWVAKNQDLSKNKKKVGY